LAKVLDNSSAETSLEGGADIVLTMSGDGSIVEVLHRGGYPAADPAAQAKGLSIENLWTEELAERVKNKTRRALKTRQVHCDECDSADSSFELVYVPQGRDRVLVIVRNVTEQNSVISRVRHLAYVDEPTGLPNREFLLAELGRFTDELRLREGRAAVICFDIDNLDLPGYAVGSQLQDAVLKVLAARLANGLRSANQSDPESAERYSIAARIDYRKLAVVLPRIESGSAAAAVAQRLADSLQQPVKIEGRCVSVTVCAGIALFPQDGTDAMTLFDNSHAAMEDAKNSASGPQQFHTGTARVKALQRQDMELELRSALHRDELELHYLPIVASGSRQITCVEALLRWPQTGFGAQSIQKVVSLAEHTGLIVPIGEWILRQTCEKLREWHVAGFSDLRLAVNLSVQEFSRPDLAAKIAEILSDFSLDPGFVDCEITEHMLFRDAMKNYATCRRLKELGVGVIIDDYGTGVCSLGHLAHSPVDAIKIDNSFVANSGSNPRDRKACSAATEMAHKLGMKSIAEGVETEEQAGLLAHQGCDFLQGFLFSKPAAADEMEG
jgi:diguanylate cyclase (GGDEF)-like protein